MDVIGAPVPINGAFGVIKSVLSNSGARTAGIGSAMSGGADLLPARPVAPGPTARPAGVRTVSTAAGTWAVARIAGMAACEV